MDAGAATRAANPFAGCLSSGQSGFHLYFTPGAKARLAAMQGLKWTLARCLPILMLATAGCASHITNLTPSIVPRANSGLYHFEAEWTSNQRSRQLRQDQIRGFVVVDEKFYPMARVPRMPDRWESEVPIPAGENPVFYYYKWDYGTAGFGGIHPNSLRSQSYRLEIKGSVL